MTTVALIGAGATIVGVIISFSYSIFRIGQWATETAESHDDQMIAHYRMHKDMEKMANSINGEDFFMTDNCRICRTVEENDKWG